MSVIGQSMTFKISNSISAGPLEEALTSRGVGLNHARRRLELIYPGAHALSVLGKPGVFEVDLEMILQKTSASTLPEMAENEI